MNPLHLEELCRRHANGLLYKPTSHDIQKTRIEWSVTCVLNQSRSLIKLLRLPQCQLPEVHLRAELKLVDS